MRFIFIFVLLLFSIKLFAISEKNYSLQFKQLVTPYLESLNSDYFLSHDGIRIHYLSEKQVNNKNNCLVILPGQSESAIQYSELAYDISQSEFGKNTRIFILDIRGQGNSERTAIPLDMGHVEYFSDYTSDLELFLNTVISNEQCQKKFVFGHSMGAGILISFLAHHSKYFDAVAVSSPMLKVLTGPYPYLLIDGLAIEEILRGRGNHFAVGQLPFNPNETFEENDYTNSIARHKMMMDLYEQFPETKIGGLSNRWVYEVMKETRHRRKYYKKISTPIKLFRAGIDKTVSMLEIKNFCSKAPNCEESFFPDARHAIFNDQDPIREKAIDELLIYFEKF